MIKLNKELEDFIAKTDSFKFDYELKNINWFQVGGKADLVFRPKNKDELQNFLKLKADLPIFVLGVGSNVIIRDGGYRGCIIRLGRGFTEVEKLPDNRILVGAANLDVNVSLYAKNFSITGLEFLSGIPGTIGGGVAMNAGAYGGEFKDVLIEAHGYDALGNFNILTNQDLGFSYRKSKPKIELIYISAILQGESGEKEQIAKKIKEIQDKREESQPLRTKTGGSTFKNPKDKKAWQLVDEAGCRGLEVGGAKISEKHCNFMINFNDAKAKDLEDLGNEVKRKVKEKLGVDLEWEIKIIGEK